MSASPRLGGKPSWQAQLVLGMPSGVAGKRDGAVSEEAKWLGLMGIGEKSGILVDDTDFHMPVYPGALDGTDSSSSLQRTVTCPLFSCLTPWAHSTSLSPSTLSPSNDTMAACLTKSLYHLKTVRRSKCY